MQRPITVSIAHKGGNARWLACGHHRPLAVGHGDQAKAQLTHDDVQARIQPLLPFDHAGGHGVACPFVEQRAHVAAL
ncbi:hypothetical protein Tther_00804 [Tepidimonas thermarum]|uniref:Uncharacterized protein n=2 Tax=Tepidimonas thermarum TaxID=335431 RepID=A0A554X4Z1_9BURK|nr:hypothetical protein Tther_00804 [Tepidimonas thermarum]